jgi:Cdc6-like AAA superfamily ATPase
MSIELSLEAQAVLRTLLRRRGKPATGEELLERIFASTGEVPLDNERLCVAVTELEGHGFVSVSRTGSIPVGYDFAMVILAQLGEEYALG